MKTLAYFARPLTTVAPRDLLLLESLGPRPTDTALEVGTGSGSSLFRLAPCVAALHGVDVCEGPVERLRRVLAGCKKPVRDVRLFTLDFCQPRAASRLPTRYDLIFSCDTLEHVPDAGAFFTNLYQALKPGGRAFLTYPNEHPSRAHGITFFERRDALEALLRQAGFAPDRVTIATLRMARAAEKVLAATWLFPRAFVKKLRQAFRGNGRRDSPPQSFDETDFFAASGWLEPLAPLINAYCYAVMRLMSLAHPVYQVAAAPECLWDTRVLIRASRSSESGE